MTINVCFSDRLGFSLCIIPAFYLMFNENQIAVEENRIPKLSDAYAAMRTLHRYRIDMKNIVFQLKEILNDQSLKCLRQSKITDFFTAKCV